MPFLQPPFPPRHFREVGVVPIRIEQKVFAGKPRALGIGRERTRHELPAVVEARRDAMHRADEGAAPAADHAEAQAPLESLIL